VWASVEGEIVCTMPGIESSREQHAAALANILNALRGINTKRIIVQPLKEGEVKP
jgi:hypothetical protein